MTERSGDAWWAAVSATAPPGLAGLWFGLTNLAAGGWHIYVAGTPNFDADDETADWAAEDYLWFPEGRYFPFPAAGADYYLDGLAAAASFVRALQPWTRVPVDGVATGFDEGDFEVVYTSKAGPL